MKVALLYDAPAAHLQRLRASAPSARFVCGKAHVDAARDAVADASVIMGNWHFTEALSEQTQTALRFVQSNSVGVERQIAAITNPEAILCNARGLYDDEMADHT